MTAGIPEPVDQAIQHATDFRRALRQLNNPRLTEIAKSAGKRNLCLQLQQRTASVEQELNYFTSGVTPLTL